MYAQNNDIQPQQDVFIGPFGIENPSPYYPPTPFNFTTDATIVVTLGTGWLYRTLKLISLMESMSLLEIAKHRISTN